MLVPVFIHATGPLHSSAEVLGSLLGVHGRGAGPAGCSREL